MAEVDFNARVHRDSTNRGEVPRMPDDVVLMEDSVPSPSSWRGKERKPRDLQYISSSHLCELFSRLGGSSLPW